MIQTYIFWNQHEPQPGQYNFEGNLDLVKFINEIQAQGLYATLRIVPFIEAEWNYGGLPFWVHDIPRIVYRSNNEPFKYYMQNFTTKIVNLMKSEALYAPQGGPIILSQDKQYVFPLSARDIFINTGSAVIRTKEMLAATGGLGHQPN